MLRNILIGLVVLILLAVAGAYVTPRNVHVERDIVINASAAEIFPYLNNYQHFYRWSPWSDRDPNATYAFEGPAEGVGARMTWSGNKNVGTGSQEISVSEFPNHLETLLDFDGQGTAVAYFDLTPAEGGGTRVVWGFDTDMGMNPVARYMGLLMDKFVGADYQEGLENLRDLVESETAGE